MGIEMAQIEHREGNSDVLSSAKEALGNCLMEKQKTNTPVLLLLSGGSSLALLDDQNTIVGSNVTIAPLDERYSTNPQENNMAQIAATDFYARALENGARTIDTRVREGESREELAKRFNDGLLEWITSNPEGKIIATTGIGPDGHVSGIMPHPEDKEGFRSLFDDGESEHLVVGYDAGNKNQFPQRVTTTLNLMHKIDTAIAYVTGENKREAIRRVLADEGSTAETPARILKEIAGKVLLFTDQHWKLDG